MRINDDTYRNISMYVYIYLDPTEPGAWDYLDNNFAYRPLYVGVGTKPTRRVIHWRNARCKYEGKEHDYVNPILYDKLSKLIEQKLEPIIIKLYDNSGREIVCDHEVAIIKHFGKIKDKNGGILCNIGDGGEYQRIGTIESQCRPVVKFDMQGKKLAEFMSVAHAERDAHGKNKGTVGTQLRGETATAHGHIYKYKSEVGDTDQIDALEHLSRFSGNVGKRDVEVYQYNINGKLIASYQSCVAAEDATGIQANSIMRSSKLNGYIQGYIWTRTKFDDIVLTEEHKEKVLHYHTKVYRFNLFNDMTEYVHLYQAAGRNGISMYKLKKFLRNKMVSNREYYWSLTPEPYIPINYVEVIDADYVKKLMLKAEASLFCGVADFRTLSKQVSNNSITIKTKRHQD